MKWFNDLFAGQASQYARSLIEASLDPLVTISPEGKITDVNEATIKVTGVGRQGLIGTDFSNYFTEPDKAREGYRQVFEKGFVTDYPLTVRHRDGKLVDVLYNAIRLQGCYRKGPGRLCRSAGYHRTEAGVPVCAEPYRGEPRSPCDDKP